MASTVPGIVLAGGLATRMGGGDKGFLTLGDKTLLDHVITRLRPQCDPIALNANGDPMRFASLGLPVLPDSVPGFPGPLAGILAGLDWASSLGREAIVTVAQDTPFLPVDLVDRLQQALSQGGVSVALAASADEDGTLRRHPTFGLWPVALREDLRVALGQGVRKVGLWAHRHGVAVATFSSEPIDPFFNVNTPEDARKARKLLEERGA
jgi:molybdopterin-guanine dinucleotide biosynthesis protein A